LNRLVVEGGAMPSYVSLISWTDQGVKNFKDTIDRYEAAQAAVGEGGATFRDIYWTLGPYDLVAVLDAPDDETAMAALLSVAGEGNIRTTTLRAFNADEMRGVIEKTT
jgi:uncharacterized protein with GYD domain